MLSGFSISKNPVLSIATTTLFAVCIVTLPRYIEIARHGFVLLIVMAFFYLAFNIRQLRQTSGAERAFFAVVSAEFIWIAFTYYLNGKTGQGHAFLWSRHFYMLFLIPMFFLFRKVRISDRMIIVLLCCSVALTFADLVIDFALGTYQTVKGINRNGLGPIQLCLSSILLFYFIKRPGQALRWLALAGFFLGIATVIFCQSRTTWISMVVVGVLFAFYLARRLSSWQRIVLTMGVILILSSSYLLPIVKKRIDRGITSTQNYLASDHYSDEARLSDVGVRIELWKTGWHIFLEHPVTGVGVGGFQVMARANWEQYQVNKVVGYYGYAHNQYLVALATRGLPGLILFLLFMTLPIYIAMKHKSDDAEDEVARLSIIFICLAYLVGCLGEDHFETQPAIMFVSLFLALLLARISNSNRDVGALNQKHAADANALSDMTSQTPADKRIRISIILPVYNVAGFLPECLQSIIDQSFDHEIEALLIDDCSTDDSKLICENFVREYATIFKLFTHEKNGGVSVARNTGLDNALGDYFMFVDPDDVLPAGALQSLYIAATQYNADIVKGNNTIFNELGEHNARFDVTSQAMITGDDVLTTLYDHTRVRGHPWGKFFNRNRLGHIRFPVAMRFGEDVYYCAQLFSEAKSLLLIAKPVYRYRKMDTGSSSRKFETGTYLTMIDSIEELGAFARTPHQARTHKGLQLRTLAEIARECRKIDTAMATVVLSVIEQKCVQWNIRLPDLLRDKLPLRDLARYAKLQHALSQIRRNLAQSS